MGLVEALSRHLGSGALEELTLTTNGSQLAAMPGSCSAMGVRRINVSLDTRDPGGSGRSPAGAISTRCSAGSPRRATGLQVKINMVALKGVNEHEIEPMLNGAVGLAMDLALIETMPLGDIDGDHRSVSAVVAGAGAAAGALSARGDRL